MSLEDNKTTVRRFLEEVPVEQGKVTEQWVYQQGTSLVEHLNKNDPQKEEH